MNRWLHSPSLNAGVVAAHCGVSLRVLYREFEKDLRTTPMECLLKMRLRLAKDMLAHGDRKIEDVSEACGFANLRTFQRAFQRKQGVAPTQWRRERNAGRFL
jgi:transcriptional regulator GlxA family with amidase domain